MLLEANLEFVIVIIFGKGIHLTKLIGLKVLLLFLISQTEDEKLKFGSGCSANMVVKPHLKLSPTPLINYCTPHILFFFQ